jgi:hypothetical protein
MPATVVAFALRRRRNRALPLENWRRRLVAKTNRFGALAAAAALVAVGLVVLMMLLVVEVRPAEATVPGKIGKIAYQAYDGHDAEIYTISPGGGGTEGVNSVSPTIRRRTSIPPSRQTASG